MAFKREARIVGMIGVRVSAAEDELLEGLARALELRGKADVFRAAFDFWLAESREAKQAVGVLEKGSKRKRGK